MRDEKKEIERNYRTIALTENVWWRLYKMSISNNDLYIIWYNLCLLELRINISL